MNRNQVNRYRALLRIKYWVYMSRVVFWQSPVNYDLIVAISLKINRLMKVIDSEKVAVNDKTPVK